MKWPHLVTWLLISIVLWQSERNKKKIMSQLSDAATKIEGRVQDVGTGIKTEIQQLADAIAAGADTAAVIARLDAQADKLAQFKVDLDADDAPAA